VGAISDFFTGGNKKDSFNFLAVSMSSLLSLKASGYLSFTSFK